MVDPFYALGVVGSRAPRLSTGTRRCTAVHSTPAGRVRGARRAATVERVSRFSFDDPRLTQLRADQDGMVAQRQLRTLGAAPHDVKRMLRRRDLSRTCYPGVYVDHTGQLTRRQREWGAVLGAWPAVLAGESALGQSTGVVHIAIAHGRKVRAQPGVVVRSIVDLDDRAQWNRSPPKVRLEHAVIDAMSEKIAADDVAGAFAALCRLAHSRRTTADRILEVLATRDRVAGRRIIEGMLTDLRDGVCSVLERGYRHRVARPHGLPPARRQHASRATGRRTYQDVCYPAFDLIVEMDGLAFHESAQARDGDALRDLAELATSAARTARVTYGLVFTHTCQTAWWIAQILQSGGWQGTFTPCPSCPPA